MRTPAFYKRWFSSPRALESSAASGRTGCGTHTGAEGGRATVLGGGGREQISLGEAGEGLEDPEKVKQDEATGEGRGGESGMPCQLRCSRLPPHPPPPEARVGGGGSWGSRREQDVPPRPRGGCDREPGRLEGGIRWKEWDEGNGVGAARGVHATVAGP